MNETYNDINVYIEKINAVIEEVKKRKYDLKDKMEAYCSEYGIATLSDEELSKSAGEIESIINERLIDSTTALANLSGARSKLNSIVSGRDSFNPWEEAKEGIEILINQKIRPMMQEAAKLAPQIEEEISGLKLMIESDEANLKKYGKENAFYIRRVEDARKYQRKVEKQLKSNIEKYNGLVNSIQEVSTRFEENKVNIDTKDFVKLEYKLDKDSTKKPEQAEQKQEEGKKPEQTEQKQEENKKPEQAEQKQEEGKKPEQTEQKQEENKKPEQAEQKQEESKKPEQTKQKQEESKKPEQAEQKQEEGKKPEQAEQKQEESKKPEQAEQKQEESKTANDPDFEEVPFTPKKKQIGGNSLPAESTEDIIKYLKENTDNLDKSVPENTDFISKISRNISKLFNSGKLSKIGFKKQLHKFTTQQFLNYKNFLLLNDGGSFGKEVSKDIKQELKDSIEVIMKAKKPEDRYSKDRINDFVESMYGSMSSYNVHILDENIKSSESNSLTDIVKLTNLARKKIETETKGDTKMDDEARRQEFSALPDDKKERIAKLSKSIDCIDKYLISAINVRNAKQQVDRSKGLFGRFKKYDNFIGELSSIASNFIPRSKDATDVLATYDEEKKLQANLQKNYESFKDLNEQVNSQDEVAKSDVHNEQKNQIDPDSIFKNGETIDVDKLLK